MSIKRISAVLLQELFITYRSAEVIFDVFVYSVIQLLLFGFLSIYLAAESSSNAAIYLLVGMLLWEMIRIIQYSVTVGSLWNIWSRNLSNMFIAPLSATEYLTAHTISGIVKSLLVFSLNAAVTWYVFGFNIFSLGPMLGIYLLELTVFAFAAGIAILGLIFRYGTRIQAFAWGLLPILQPLTATFFPIGVLPPVVQLFAWIFPSTYFFEAVRFQLDTGRVDWGLIGTGTILNTLYVFCGILFFSYMFKASRNSGQFSRNES